MLSLKGLMVQRPCRFLKLSGVQHSHLLSILQVPMEVKSDMVPPPPPPPHTHTHSEFLIKLHLSSKMCFHKPKRGEQGAG